ncbi:hypothetical protein JZ751_017742 [Albula glossodonta]|uniref:Uncharacterized protein n=1 Tax=Albula glossodonta TaxID=121402 RepID=A0A8T2PP83_9TELE|nr:hypothetical protein JZ751_017742 [Albula glossodonta]
MRARKSLIRHALGPLFVFAILNRCSIRQRETRINSAKLQHVANAMKIAGKRAVLWCLAEACDVWPRERAANCLELQIVSQQEAGACLHEPERTGCLSCSRRKLWLAQLQKEASQNSQKHCCGSLQGCQSLEPRTCLWTASSEEEKGNSKLPPSHYVTAEEPLCSAICSKVLPQLKKKTLLQSQHAAGQHQGPE